MSEAILDELAPYLPIIEQFAREHGMTVRYPCTSQEVDRGDFQCQIGFVNTHGQLCFLYVDRYQPMGFQVRLMRWGLHNLIAREEWSLAYNAELTELRAVLGAARERADAATGG